MFNFFCSYKVLLDTYKKPNFHIFKKFVFIKNQGLFKVHESFTTCKCDVIYILFK
jgi:hypothetical protein